MESDEARAAIDMFLSAFNAPDDVSVVDRLSRALSPEITFWGPWGRSEGVEAVGAFVLDLRRHSGGEGTMERCSDVDAPGEWARYQWRYAAADDRSALSGTDVVHIQQGRIAQMIVFAGDIPARPADPARSV
ncbi:nuclear transport factor 2 family protein [Streptomyces kanamyceticus]|uniref:Nuclear transport factor 2 family protein n=1 Tax=Streptomyces kanamyceticus TaxID=1967 RepID=A0A5J6GPB0_STRKN|nr:nuclear transport factor 2 family protein [Streptomyces kanamyceticus]QEU96823.1 nuclear transport factor 2 family protein [Streptomyces kanamyceticus]